MSRLKNLLYSYVYNPIVENMVMLAEEYYNTQQYAAALSFFLKTADSTQDKNLQYYCLIKCAKCVEIPGNRKHSVMTLYKHCITLLPERPEAYYYLSQLHEWYKDWFDCYLFANIGLQKDEINDEYTKKLSYPGKNGLLVQKALSAWGIGKGQEARGLFQKLLHTEYKNLDAAHKKVVANNAFTLGCGPVEVCHVPYHRGKYNLRYKFSGWEKIEQNWSQVAQDLFVLSVTDGKEKGTYLEIGSGDPFHLNNTMLLETRFGWIGKGIEWNKELVARHTANRKNPVLCINALEVDYEKLLAEIADPVTKIVDYLQLDCEPSAVTYEIMTKIPFDKYRFRAITYEHDYYVDSSFSFREKSRKFLKQKGYILAANDISPEGSCTFEDWWIHPDLVDDKTKEIMVDVDLNTTKNIRDYMYKPYGQ